MIPTSEVIRYILAFGLSRYEKEIEVAIYTLKTFIGDDFDDVCRYLKNTKTSSVTSPNGVIHWWLKDDTFYREESIHSCEIRCFDFSMNKLISIPFPKARTYDHWKESYGDEYEMVIYKLKRGKWRMRRILW